MKTSRFFLSLFLLMFYTACSRKEPLPITLPGITDQGKNTFGCYVDHTLWLPSDAIQLHATRLCVKYDPSTKLLSLTCWRNNPTSGRKAADVMEIGLNNCTGTGIYDLTDPNVGGAAVAVDPELIGPSVVTSGSITIRTFDTAKKIISGTFAFTVRNRDGSVTHKITDGRFDMGLNYCL